MPLTTATERDERVSVTSTPKPTELSITKFLQNYSCFITDSVDWTGKLVQPVLQNGTAARPLLM
jgi:hypothetical protein